MSEQIDKIVYSLLENPIEDKKIDCQCFLNENQKELVLDASSVFVQNIIEQAKNSAVNVKNNDEFGMCLAAWLKKKKRLNIVKWESKNVNYPKFILILSPETTHPWVCGGRAFFYKKIKNILFFYFLLKNSSY